MKNNSSVHDYVIASANQTAAIQDILKHKEHPYSNRIRVCVDLVELNGYVDHESLREAAHYVTRRHEGLRSTFYKDNNNIFIKSINSNQNFILNLFKIPGEINYSHIYSDLFTNFSPFDSVRWKISHWRYHLENNKIKTVIGIAVDHLVCDAWSLNIILMELSTIIENMSGAKSNANKSHAENLAIEAPSLFEQILKQNDRYKNVSTKNLSLTYDALALVDFDITSRLPLPSNSCHSFLNNVFQRKMSTIHLSKLIHLYHGKLSPTAVLAVLIGNSFNDDTRMYFPIMSYAANRNNNEKEIVGWFSETFIFPVLKRNNGIYTQEDLEQIQTEWISVKNQVRYPFWLWDDLNTGPKKLNRQGVIVTLSSENREIFDSLFNCEVINHPDLDYSAVKNRMLGYNRLLIRARTERRQMHIDAYWNLPEKQFDIIQQIIKRIEQYF